MTIAWMALEKIALASCFLTESFALSVIGRKSKWVNYDFRCSESTRYQERKIEELTENQLYERYEVVLWFNRWKAGSPAKVLRKLRRPFAKPLDPNAPLAQIYPAGVARWRNERIMRLVVFISRRHDNVARHKLSRVVGELPVWPVTGFEANICED